VSSEITTNPELLSGIGEETRGRIISGTRWVTMGQGGAQLLRFLVSIVLARLLAPADFGLMAMALLFVGLMELFKDLGTVSALIQAPELSPVLLNSVFFLNVLIGMLGFAGIYLAAPLAALFFAQPGLTAILRVLGGTLLISSLGLVMRALLQRNLQFGRLAAIDLIASVAYGVVAVILAVTGSGVWALVIASLASAIVPTVLLWFSSSWKPRAHVRFAQLRQILHFSANMTGSAVFSYLIFQTDKLLIGRFIGDSALGLYSMAQRLLEVPLNFISQPIVKVLFPAFSGIQNDDTQIGLLYSRACSAIAFLTLPLLASLALLSEPFVSIVLSDKWRPAIPLITILALPTAIQCVAMTVGAIYMAKGKANWLFYWQVAAGSLTVIGMMAGLQFGLAGLATAYALVIALLTYPAFAIPLRLIGLPAGTFFKSLLPCLFATLLLMGACLGARSLLGFTGLNPLLIHLISGGAGLSAYVIAMAVIKPPALADLKEFLLPKRFQFQRLWNR
jgi:O-antigen/teichoic acid export membrane protein